MGQLRPADHHAREAYVEVGRGLLDALHRRVGLAVDVRGDEVLRHQEPGGKRVRLAFDLLVGLELREGLDGLSAAH